MLKYAGTLQLDTLSLQLRAIQQALIYEPRLARTLFESISGPQLPRLTCTDAIGYSLSSYYIVLGSIFQTAFTLEERRKGLDLQFLTTMLPAQAVHLRSSPQPTC